MSHLDRTVGLLRSIAIYHGIPFRQLRLRELYSKFVTAGDLVFDVGAHAGNRTRAFAALGCRVVALEPQPDFARLLRLLFARSPRVQVLEAAASERDGRVDLAVSERTPPSPRSTTRGGRFAAARRGLPASNGIARSRSKARRSTR
jgi:hypothetical protein